MIGLQNTFVMPMNGIHTVYLNDDVQPEFRQVLVRTARAGAQVTCYGCHAEVDNIMITTAIDNVGKYAG